MLLWRHDGVQTTHEAVHGNGGQVAAVANNTVQGLPQDGRYMHRFLLKDTIFYFFTGRDKLSACCEA